MFTQVVGMLKPNEYSLMLKSLAEAMGREKFLEACISIAREETHTDTPTLTPAQKQMNDWDWDNIPEGKKHEVCREVIQHIPSDWTVPGDISAVVPDLGLEFDNHSVVLYVMRYLARNTKSSVEWNGMRARGSKYRNRGSWAIK